jgi:uncharacterized protein
MKRFVRITLRTVVVLFIFINVVSAFHAYKFTHFYEPSEITVKTDAQKGTWDKTKEALFGINFTKKPNTATDTAYRNITLTTSDSLKIAAWYMPADSMPKGTVILFHGHGGNRSDVLSEAIAFHSLGYHALLVEFRAHGSSSGNTCTIGVDEAEEVKLAYTYVSQQQEKNIILWGISMGAAAVARAVSIHDLKPSKLILEMPFGSLLEAVEGRIKMMHLPPQPLATLLTFWGGAEHGFWAFSHKPSMYAKKFTMPVLLQWGANDPRVSRKEINDIYANISTPRKLVVFDNSGHESLYKKESAKWLTEVKQFLNP